MQNLRCQFMLVKFCQNPLGQDEVAAKQHQWMGANFSKGYAFPLCQWMLAGNTQADGPSG